MGLLGGFQQVGRYTRTDWWQGSLIEDADEVVFPVGHGVRARRHVVPALVGAIAAQNHEHIHRPCLAGNDVVVTTPGPVRSFEPDLIPQARQSKVEVPPLNRSNRKGRTLDAPFPYPECSLIHFMKF